MLIGIVVSAPMGPIGILCVQRTQKKGRWYGYITGFAASISDLIYALMTGLGMTFVYNLISGPTTYFALKILGSVLMLGFGIYCFFTDPAKKVHQTSGKKGSYRYNAITGFWLTFLNPLIIFLFMFLYAQLSFIIPHKPIEMTLGYTSIFIGANLWWYALTWGITKIKNKFDVRGIKIIDKVIGGIVSICSVFMLVNTLLDFNHIL